MSRLITVERSAADVSTTIVSALGRKEALSSLLWMLLIPTYLPAIYYIAYRHGLAQEEPLAPVIGYLITVGLKAIVIEFGRALGSRFLRGRPIDALYVAGVIICSIIFSSQLGAAVNYELFGMDIVLDTAGWTLAAFFQQICVAFAVSMWSALKQDRTELDHELRHQLQRAYELRRRVDLLTFAVSSLIDTKIAPAIQALGDRVWRLKSEADWRQWSDEVADFATGQVRTISQVAAKIAGLPAAQESDRNDRTINPFRDFMPRTRRAMAEFHLEQPVTWWSGLLLIPVGADALAAASDGWGAAMFLVLVELVALWLFARFTKTYTYRRLPRTVQWIVWAVGISVIGMLVIPIGSLIGTPETVAFGQLDQLSLDRWSQGVGFTVPLIALNAVIGIAIVGIRHQTIDVAVERSLASLQRWETDSQQVADRQIWEEIVSIIHGSVQGRLLAISMLANEVARGERQPVEVVTRIQSELLELINTELPAVVDASAGEKPATGQPLAPTLDTLVEAWQPVMKVDLTLADSLAGAVVSPESISRINRVVKEGLGNAAKHGHARHCSVDIAQGPLESVVITIKDDGIGGASASASEVAGDGVGSSLIEATTGGAWSFHSEVGGSELQARVGLQLMPGAEAEDFDFPDPATDLHDPYR